MLNKKIEELKNKYKKESIYKFDYLNEFINNNFLLVPSNKDNEIIFKINEKQSGFILFEKIDEKHIKIKDLETDVYSGLGMNKL